jgi:hypothetical protein
MALASCGMVRCGAPLKAARTSYGTEDVWICGSGIVGSKMQTTGGGFCRSPYVKAGWGVGRPGWYRSVARFNALTNQYAGITSLVNLAPSSPL